MSSKIPVPILSEDELEDYEASENGEWVSVGPIEERRAFWQDAASRKLESMREDISVSVSHYDLIRLKAKADEKGVPYQTLVNSLIHDYVDS